MNTKSKSKHKTEQLSELFNNVGTLLCAAVVHNTANNSRDNIESYPADNHHSSDAVHWR